MVNAPSKSVTVPLFKLLIEADLIYMDSDQLKSESKIKNSLTTKHNLTMI